MFLYPAGTWGLLSVHNLSCLATTMLFKVQERKKKNNDLTLVYLHSMTPQDIFGSPEHNTLDMDLGYSNASCDRCNSHCRDPATLSKTGTWYLSTQWPRGDRMGKAIPFTPITQDTPQTYCAVSTNMTRLRKVIQKAGTADMDFGTLIDYPNILADFVICFTATE